MHKEKHSDFLRKCCWQDVEAENSNEADISP